MNFEHGDAARQVHARFGAFFADHVLVRNRDWMRAVRDDGGGEPPFLDELRAEAHRLGLWNLAQTELEPGDPGMPMRHLDFAPLAERMGRLPWSAKVFNCQWPDDPNMVALRRFADAEQKRRWLDPLLAGECHSAFAMTEPDVASSDARNIATRIRRHGDAYVVQGHKWFISGASHPDCAFLLVMGVTDPDAAPNRRHGMVIVPRDAPGVEIGRQLRFAGFAEPGGPTSEIRFADVRVPAANLLGGEGDGFDVGQVRLAPARLHHCMRAIGQCELLIELMMARAAERHAFGRSLADRDTVQHDIALSRVEVEQARLLVLKTAWSLDTDADAAEGRDLSVLKVAVARTYHRIAERAVQLFGAMGGYDGAPIADAFRWSRALRIADGPDEVHLRHIYRAEPAPETGLDDSPYVLPLADAG